MDCKKKEGNGSTGTGVEPCYSLRFDFKTSKATLINPCLMI